MKARGPLFVCGYPRSGTTLLRAMLDQHPDISLVNESEVAYAVYLAGYSIHTQFDPQAKANLLAMMRRINQCQEYLEWLGEAHIEKVFGSTPTVPFTTLFEDLLPRRPEAAVWGDKTHWNLFFAPDLLSVYPQALFVYILRDGRSAAVSRAKKRLAKSQGRATDQTPDTLVTVTNSLERCAVYAQTWRAWWQAVRSIRARIPAENFLQVKYEDLIQRPEQVLGRICRVAGLEYHPAMLDTAARASDAKVAFHMSYAHQKIAQAVDPSRLAPYAALEPELIWVMELFAGQSLQAEGYELMRPALPLGTQARLGLRLLMTPTVRNPRIPTKVKPRRLMKLNRHNRARPAAPATPGLRPPDQG